MVRSRSNTVVRFVPRSAYRAEDTSGPRSAEREENKDDGCKFDEAGEVAGAEIGPAHDPERSGRQGCEGCGRDDEPHPCRCLRPVSEDKKLPLAHDRTA